MVCRKGDGATMSYEIEHPLPYMKRIFQVTSEFHNLMKELLGDLQYPYNVQQEVLHPLYTESGFSFGVPNHITVSEWADSKQQHGLINTTFCINLWQNLPHPERGASLEYKCSTPTDAFVRVKSTYTFSPTLFRSIHFRSIRIVIQLDPNLV